MLLFVALILLQNLGSTKGIFVTMIDCFFLRSITNSSVPAFMYSGWRTAHTAHARHEFE